MNRALNRTLQCALTALAMATINSSGQSTSVERDHRAAVDLSSGYQEFNAGGFALKLVKGSQTLAALQPMGAGGFDFIPSDRLGVRSGDGFYHLGDVRFRIKTGGGEWLEYSTAAVRKPVRALTANAPDLARADLSPTLPDDCPIRVLRTWTIRNGRLALNFEFENKTGKPIEVGYLGIPLEFNNILTGRSLAEAHEKCSFSDPYIGMDAGYVQVTRLKGTGPALVVVPLRNTPFEAYQLMKEPMRPQQTFEGMFEWVVLGRALAETDWQKAEPWNIPSGETLEPYAKRVFGLKFLLSKSIRSIEKTLAENGRPVAVGVPGYILPNDVEGKLFLKYTADIKGISVEPSNALKIEPMPMKANGVHGFLLKGMGWGRAGVTINYSDETRQTIQYYLSKPAVSAVDDLGRFLTTKQWYENPSDPFKRSPSIMTFDREAGRIVDQDNRVWIAGLGDEGGSGAWLAAAMKEYVRPNAEEVGKYERFIDEVLWGGIQYKEGENRFGVRKSLLYYAPQELPDFAYDTGLNWTTWASWKKDHAESVGRGYNYPHVVAAYWAMYRTARNTTGLVKNHPWEWYLDQAFQTTNFAFSRTGTGKRRVDYVELGLMEGTIFLELLTDLKREGWTEEARTIEKLMKERADEWSKEDYPFGSEMAWDSTGQEEVYAWCKHFGYEEKAAVSLESIIGYMPSIPHWGYNGNARRYWDFLYAAKLRRIERQIHHYGSGLNAIPVLTAYRADPGDEHLLRIGYAGAMAALSNIDREGFASAAFHTFPDTLKWDAYSGDYGPNFLGHALNTATYIIDMREFGWQAFGGNIRVSGDRILVAPLDSMRKRVYVAPYGLWLTLDAGTLSKVEVNKRTKAVRITLSPATEYVTTAMLRIEKMAAVKNVGRFEPVAHFEISRGAFSIPLTKKARQIDLIEKKQ